MRPARSTSTPASPASVAGQARGRDAGGPDHGAGRDACASRRGPRYGDRLGGHVDHGVPSSGVTPEPLERPDRLPRERLREAGQDAVAPPRRAGHARLRVSADAEVAAQRVVGELGDLAGHLDAGRPGADDHERRASSGAARGRARPRPPRTPRARGFGCRARRRATSAPARARATRRGRSTSTATRPRRSACRTEAAAAVAVRQAAEQHLATGEVEPRSPRPAPPGRSRCRRRIAAKRRRDLGARRARPSPTW